MDKLSLALQPNTIPSLVIEAAAKYSDITAIRDGEESISYAELPERALDVTKGLLNLGVQKGDRVAVWAPNSARWILAAIGLQMAGAVLVPLNTRMKAHEAQDILHRSGAKVLFSVGDFLSSDYAAELEKVAPSCLEKIIVLSERQAEPNDNMLEWDALIRLGNTVSQERLFECLLSLESNDASDLMFTSGTTGKPKGVVSIHSACVNAFREYVQVLALKPGERYLVINPFFHAFGYKAGWVASLIAGATILPEQVFDAETVLNRIESERINILPGPPTLYLSLLAHPKLDRYDLSSLRVAVTGASTIPPVLIESMRTTLGIETVTTAYGLTECGGLATICDPLSPSEVIAQTSGKAIVGTEVAILSQQGQALAQGEAGEVCIRGFHVMKEYFQDPHATAETIDADQWLHTGDLGVLDPEGNLQITGRIKDMFIVGGFNCYPAEIEAALAENNQIAQSAVIGVPDERMGEVGCAFIVVKTGCELDEAELIRWSRERMSNYKVPRYVRFVDSLPVNASNKVLKNELAQQFKSEVALGTE
ncbi:MULTISPECIES: FadD3 family acyl-CoA ligase [Vibrio]|uniref:FadD3 family acyl-CoA ligase n=1 Tax=Vibrio TaxID=662 RepID=UPI000E6A201E|nr:FadD3 family acyl-CoA ligase [Vibrio sp. PID23_8]RIZ52958.1 fatty acid--CoA ligase [Vibrio sp. PID23_8]